MVAGHHHDQSGGEHDGARLALAAGLTGGFMVVEAVGGWLSGSLALIADAGHMLTDFASLVMAWLATRVAARPADRSWTFGFDRVAVLAALINGLALFVIAAMITWEAVHRVIDPPPVMGWPMLAIAVVGLGVNLIAFRILHGGSGGLNIRAAALHVAGDLLGSVGAIAAAAIILTTGWTAADPILSVVVSCIILVAAWRVVRDSGRILLEATPVGVDLPGISGDLARIAGVRRVHHLHAWAISEERPMITLHVEITPDADPDTVREALRRRLADAHGFTHSTIEMERPDMAMTDPS